MYINSQKGGVGLWLLIMGVVAAGALALESRRA